MSRSPYFQFYPSDFLVGTATMSAEAVGAYIVMLCHAWEGEGVPDNLPVLKRITGASEAAILEAKAKFELGEDGKLRNRRQEETRAKLDEYRATQSARALKRWGKTVDNPPKSLCHGIQKTMPRHKDEEKGECHGIEKPMPRHDEVCHGIEKGMPRHTKTDAGAMPNQSQSQITNDEAKTPPKGGESIWGISKRLEAIEKRMAELVRDRWQDAVGDFHWSDQAKRVEYLGLVEKSKQLQNQLIEV